MPSHRVAAAIFHNELPFLTFQHASRHGTRGIPQLQRHNGGHGPQDGAAAMQSAPDSRFNEAKRHQNEKRTDPEGESGHSAGQQMQCGDV